MARHERDQKIRRVVRVFLYFLIISFLLILFVIVKRWEQKQSTKNTTPTAMHAAENFPPDDFKPC
jgi:large-conductance mechanosensitive channel